MKSRLRVLGSVHKEIDFSAWVKSGEVTMEETNYQSLFGIQVKYAIKIQFWSRTQEYQTVWTNKRWKIIDFGARVKSTSQQLKSSIIWKMLSEGSKV